MATTQSQNKQSHVSSDNSNKLTPAQTEARTILNYVLTQLQSHPYYNATYGPWIQRNGHTQLLTFCHTLVLPQTWNFLSHRWSLDALKPLSGDLRYSGRAIYLDGILGLDKRLRIYVGQSHNLRARVAQHLNFRYRRDHSSLHYFALQESVYNVLGAVIVLPGVNSGPGTDDMPLLMNVLELWMCLIFRSLPIQVLEEWLPDDGSVERKRKAGKEGVVGGLNVACPLDQGRDERTFVDLSDEEDPLIKAYLKEVRRKKKEKGEEDEIVRRKEVYAEKARGYKGGDGDIRVPQWVLYSVLAGVLGYILVSSRVGQKLRWWMR
ncbi:hypothetical protein COCSADRAFT_39036 [Bipolaris sorokiniana ND90Pr]|uniref:GIY-YIG domain-containing protein n=1 Tax=Cochliobolus sativus (strain ND90Pr / ATCC 201652) TaxID=665912 RepID=M2SFT5_COCSN|nr:uncharacterized protein COCSADRAFT_39036 [Bipolaris sorokiniana ND90Pr]EMD61300.1 hypothetical protein COCSADRAFT_39036 [Bipolaris sorokiniana ND90Pr]